MGDTKLSYINPATSWQQGLPIGNGRMGAVVQGGIASERWSLTEVTYWSGRAEAPKGTAGGRAALEEMRRAYWANDYEEGERLATETLQPEKGNFGTNLALADLVMAFGGGSEGDGFRRELDLEEGIVTHAFSRNGLAVKREAFASHPAGVLVCRVSGEAAGNVSFALHLRGRTPSFAATSSGEGVIRFASQALEDVHSDGTCGVHAAGMVRIVSTGGAISADGDGLRLEGADEAVIYVAVATDYGRSDDGWRSESEAAIAHAVAAGYDALRAEHLADHGRLFGRVRLDLGSSARSLLPTNERVSMLAGDVGGDPGLFALFYQYGRYLTIAGSRKDSPLPMNLQGIWNDGEANAMAWSCDYHLDVNTEMNYYPTEAANLAECQVPLTRFVRGLAESGRAAASAYYGSDGWVAHVFTNAWGFASPGWGLSWGMNVTGGLWIAMQLKEHYEFGRDLAFLEETAYPVLKEAALFFLNYMTIHPAYGWLVTGPSNSPENSFYLNGDAAGRDYSLSMGPTMDMMLVRELFQFCAESSKLRGADEGFRDRLERAIAMLPPLRIGARGQLQEWLEDYGEAQPDHRHMSHLYGLYPGGQITPRHTPELAEAARTTLRNRMAREGLEDVEFTLAQFAASFARLGDGENAHKQLVYLIGRLCFDNLLTFSKPGIAGAETNIFVADGNFGGTAAIGEMLMQSHAGAIELLPALPAVWLRGEAAGLRAKGEVEADIRWEEGRLTEATLRPARDGRLAVRYGDRTAAWEGKAGDVWRLDGELRAMLME